MKLRRVGALLDLDDPLDASESDSSEWETDSESGEGLWTVFEEQEEERGNDEDDFDEQHEEEQEDAKEEHTDNQSAREGACGFLVGDCCRLQAGEAGAVREAGVAFVPEEGWAGEDQSDSEEYEQSDWEERQRAGAAAFNPFSLLSEDTDEEEQWEGEKQQQQQQQQLVVGREDGQPDCPAGNGRGPDRGDPSGPHLGEGERQDEQRDERRDERQDERQGAMGETAWRRRRRRPRRRRRRCAPAQTGAAGDVAVGAVPPAAGIEYGDDDQGSFDEEEEAEEAEGFRTAATEAESQGQVENAVSVIGAIGRGTAEDGLGWEFSSGAGTRTGSSPGSGSGLGSASGGDGLVEKQSDVVDDGSCDHGEGDSRDDLGNARHDLVRCDDGDHGGGVAECWLCYGEGRLPTPEWTRGGDCRGGGGGSSQGHGADAQVEAEAGQENGNEGREKDEGIQELDPGLDPDLGPGSDLEMVAPCRVCSGGLQYIHRCCFARWLDSSWAIACPNCRTMYDSAILDAHTDGPSVRAMLVGSCPPGHDLRQPFPPLSLVHFCVTGTVELSMSCGGFTAVELLRRIRLLVDDMTAQGGDGGLGLLRDDGSPLELPNFDITSLVLDLGPAGPQPSAPGSRGSGAGRGAGAGGPAGERSGLQHASEGGSSESEWGPPQGSPYSGAFINGRFNPAYGYEDEYDNGYDFEYDNDNYDYDDDDEVNDDDGDTETPALSVLRQRSFTSGTPGHVIHRHVRQQGGDAAADVAAAADARRMMDQELGWWVPRALRSDSGAGAHRRDGARGGFTSSLAALEPHIAGVAVPHRHSEAAMARGAVSDRAVQRAEQQRRRADLLQQQRNQQRYAAGSRGQHAAMGPPRGQGGRRR